MADILQVASKLARTNVTKTLVKILNKKSVQKFITDLNTKVQLFDMGEDSRGVQLASIGGSYAPSTIRIKARKNQPSNRVTLKDTGEFHKSFDVQVKPNANFTITADTNKGDQDLEDRWGDDIIGLQKENVVLVMEMLEREFYKVVFRGL
tara:strand:- start:1599 stop:2048 length:450 start_codon:yes stop_codon:yes gene_type:complete